MPIVVASAWLPLVLQHNFYWAQQLTWYTVGGCGSLDVRLYPFYWPQLLLQLFLLLRLSVGGIECSCCCLPLLCSSSATGPGMNVLDMLSSPPLPLNHPFYIIIGIRGGGGCSWRTRSTTAAMEYKREFIRGAIYILLLLWVVVGVWLVGYRNS